MNFESSSINNSGFQVGCLWIRITNFDSNPQLFVLPVEDPIPRRLQHTLLHNIKFQFTILNFLCQIPLYFYIFTPQYRFTAFGLIQPKHRDPIKIHTPRLYAFLIQLKNFSILNCSISSWAAKFIVLFSLGPPSAEGHPMLSPFLPGLNKYTTQWEISLPIQFLLDQDNLFIFLG